MASAGCLASALRFMKTGCGGAGKKKAPEAGRRRQGQHDLLRARWTEHRHENCCSWVAAVLYFFPVSALLIARPSQR